MKRRMLFFTIVAIILILTLLPAAKKPAEETANNLSFPVIALDGFSITKQPAPSFTVPYAGDYPGLSTEAIAWLEANGDPLNNAWYAQKTIGNLWQADFDNSGAISGAVNYIDWSDNIESQNPKVRSSFRLEITLYKNLDTPMKAYLMMPLEYPNSSSELQGANTTTHDSYKATVISGKPRLIIQQLGTIDPASLTWDGTRWISGDQVPTIISVTFAPELNVGGNYIYGAASGGWKPRTAGVYRITFHVPADSNISLATAAFDNEAGDYTPADPVAFPVLLAEYNLTYVDVTAVAK